MTKKKGVAVLDTPVHGGVNAYQWVNVPLGLTGRVDKKDGSVIWIDYGFDDGDPVLLIPDLALHVDRDLRSRTRAEAIKREELDPLITSAPAPGGEDDAEGEDGGDEEGTNAAVADAMARAVALVEEEFGIEPDDWSFTMRLVAGHPAGLRNGRSPPHRYTGQQRSGNRLDAKIRTDLTRQQPVDLRMPWNRTAAVPSLVPPPRVASPFTDQLAILCPKVPQKGSALHATTTFSSL